MIKAIFWYTDGSIVERDFASLEEARWFAQCEGDHLTNWEADSQKEFQRNSNEN